MRSEVTEVVFGPGEHTLLVNGEAVGPLVVADTAATRRKGLLGSTSLVGALWITRCPTVHMVGMKYAIDVAVVDKRGRVLRVATLRPWVGMTGPRLRASATLEAPAGSMTEWGISRGDVLTYE